MAKVRHSLRVSTIRSPTCSLSAFQWDQVEEAHAYHEAASSADHVTAAELLGQVGRILLAVRAEQDVVELTLLVLVLRGLHHHVVGHRRNLRALAQGGRRGVVNTLGEHLTIRVQGTDGSFGRCCVQMWFRRVERLGDPSGRKSLRLSLASNVDIVLVFEANFLLDPPLVLELRFV